MIRLCKPTEFEDIYNIINAAARVYKGRIPRECWQEPYMLRTELEAETDSGVVFWGYAENSELVGVMGLQRVQGVTLIRHAYVDPDRQREGIGSRLLIHLLKLTETPVLVGTWKAASWAIRFYQKYGFELIEPPEKKNRLLKTYWTVPKAQRESSVVLGDVRWPAPRDPHDPEGPINCFRTAP